MKPYNYLLTAQGIYYLVTGLWPLVHMESFLVVTGPKTDTWLVKTVAALLIPVSLTMLAGINSKIKNATPVIVLASTAAIAFICIDFYYSLAGVIRTVYMLDGVIQAFFLAAWAAVLARMKLVRAGQLKHH
jgi:hypothetical protein